jgi:hypothetical protein
MTIRTQIAAIVLVATGCVGPAAPLDREFCAIASAPYMLHAYDCSNMSGRYCRALRAAGYDADVVLLAHPDKRRGHAVVRVTLYYDPAKRLVGLPSPAPYDGRWEIVRCATDGELASGGEFR